MKQFDVAIIGAGVTGCAIARELGRRDVKTVLIDGAADIAMGASRANSAIVHAGYDCVPGTLMATLNVRGNKMFTEWCEELSVPLQRIGSLVVGFSKEDEESLRKLYERGLENGVPELSLISGDEARAMEPSLSPEVTMALHAGTAGITCPYEFTMACAENARANGCTWMLNSRVSAMEQKHGCIVIHAGKEEIEAKFVVDAAGVYADEVAEMLGDKSFTLKPRKGEYMLFDHAAKPLKKVIFQTPSALGKGVLVSPTVDNNIFVGPTAVDQNDKSDTSVSAASMDSLGTLGRRSVPSLDFRKVITSFAGIRAVPEKHDFIIQPSLACNRMLLAAGICSPGLSSAPAIAEVAVGMLTVMGLDAASRKDFVATRKRAKPFSRMTDDERAEAIAANPLYGRVICRCETVTEAEIVDAIKRGATTVDGVKRRTRAGMGRCQGGFCGPKVMEILSRELKVPMDQITKFGGNSKMVVGKTR